jgi:SAM-dependent methyltransferase
VTVSHLPAEAFRRYDESPDPLFYVQPRFVTHLDEAAIAAVRQLYRELFPPGGSILDLMSSWVSHLPPEIAYQRVVGLGLNQQELAANPRLDAAVVQDLNVDPRLPFGSEEFDGAAICVSIQYLTQPAAVLREVSRVLRPGAPLVVTFSNRCFPTKAVAIWQVLDDIGHAQLVAQYLREAGTWADIQALNRSPRLPGADPLFAVVARAHHIEPADDGRSTL